MKNILWIITLTFTTLSISQEKYSISQNAQTLSWIGKAAVGGYAPKGTLEIQSADMLFTSEEIIELTIVVDMQTLDQENRQLRDHLREEDFFYIEKFPTATFTLSEVAPIENGAATLIGTMTIRGESQMEKINATLSFSEGEVALSFEQILDRTRYGVNHNSPSIFKRIKENAIADDFVLKGTLLFQK